MNEPKEHWELEAQKLKESRKFEEAIKVLDKVQELEKEEKEENFWYKKAIHFCEIGEYEQAKESLFKELELNQKSFDALFLMGKICFELKKYDESLEYYNKASENHASNHLRNVQKIENMKKVRKFEEVVIYSDRVHQEKALDFDYWYHKAMALLMLKKFQDASACFHNCLEKNAENPEILYELAKSELNCNNKKKCYEALEKACAIDSKMKEKVRVDRDFDQINEESQFRVIIGLLSSDF